MGGSIFKVFVAAIMKEMKAMKGKDLDRKKLVVVGAHSVARHIQIKDDMVVKPKVNVDEEGARVLDHVFTAETTKFHYRSMERGRPKDFFKGFAEMDKECLEQCKLEGKKTKAEVARDKADADQYANVIKRLDNREAEFWVKEAQKNTDPPATPTPGVKSKN